jgi:integrase
LSAAVEWDLVRVNVADRAHPPRAENNPQDYWTPEQVGRFLEATADDRWGTLVLMWATTGCRRGELLGLCWPYVELDEARISIARTRTVIGGKVVWSEPKTKRSHRLIKLDSVTAAALRSWRARQSAERLVMGGHWGNDEDLVFVWPDGTPPNPEAITLRFKRLVEKAGLPKLTPKGLRHSFATAGLASGVPIKVISDRLGHSSIRITGDIYSHVIPELDATAAETVAQLFLSNRSDGIRDQSVTTSGPWTGEADKATR